MLITPLQFLALMAIVTIAAAVSQWVVRRRQMSRLRRLARACDMHFSAADRFRLAPRIAALLPVPGAAAVRVADLIYGVERDNYRYVFATEYTTGVLRTKTSVRRVATYREPRLLRDAREPCAAPPAGALIFAPESLPLFEQYQHLLHAGSKSP